MGNFLDAPITTKVTFSEQDDNIKFASCEMQGWRYGMEDRSIIQTSLKELPGHHFLAVFDGHGGDEVSDYCSKNIVRMFIKEVQLQSPKTTVDDLARALEATYFRLDQELKRDIFCEDGSIIRTHKTDSLDVGHFGTGKDSGMNDLIRKIQKFDSIMSDQDHNESLAQQSSLPENSPPSTVPGFRSVDTCGTTALCAVITPTHILVSNAGDSRGILQSGSGIHILSEDHKPNLEAEKTRILEAGAQISGHRVNGKLAVSRTLGDHAFKLNPFKEPRDQAISPEPEIEIIERTEEDEFLLLACDGIWDVMTNEDVADFIRHQLGAGEQSIKKVLEDLEDYCLKKESRDNMTAVLAAFPSAWTSSHATHFSARYVEDWSIQDVKRWLISKNYSEYQTQFEINKIDGQKLWLLTEEELSSKLRLKRNAMRKELWEDICLLRKGFLAWTVEHVINWLRQSSFDEFEDFFREKNIDGVALNNLSKDEFKAMTNALVKDKLVTKGKQGKLVRRFAELKKNGIVGDFKWQRAALSSARSSSPRSNHQIYSENSPRAHRKSFESPKKLLEEIVGLMQNPKTRSRSIKSPTEQEEMPEDFERKPCQRKSISTTFKDMIISTGRRLSLEKEKVGCITITAERKLLPQSNVQIDSEDQNLEIEQERKSISNQKLRQSRDSLISPLDISACSEKEVPIDVENNLNPINSNLAGSALFEDPEAALSPHKQQTSDEARSTGCTLQ